MVAQTWLDLSKPPVGVLCVKGRVTPFYWFYDSCKYNDEKKKKTIIREYNNNHNERPKVRVTANRATVGID